MERHVVTVEALQTVSEKQIAARLGESRAERRVEFRRHDNHTLLRSLK